MKTAILGLLAETPVHPGSGRGMGVVDLPVAREAATDYPVIVGSSLKGALLDKAKATELAEHQQRFGTQEQGGDLLISDGRLLLLPVRSLTSSYRWATCPHLIERYRRDRGRAGLAPLPEVPQVARGRFLSAAPEREEQLFLEERHFTGGGESVGALVETLEPLVLHADTQARLQARLVVLHDDDFTWFARYGLSIQARNFLAETTKKSRNLWYEETLPPDTVMYAIVMGRSNKAIGALDTLFPEDDPYLQAGGNETVGQGWFGVSVVRQDAQEEQAKS